MIEWTGGKSLMGRDALSQILTELNTEESGLIGTSDAKREKADDETVKTFRIKNNKIESGFLFC